MAGLDYELEEQDGTIVLQQSGYTDKALVLWQHLLEKMKTHIVRPDRFLVYKQEVITIHLALAMSLMNYRSREAWRMLTRRNPIWWCMDGSIMRSKK
jgi:secreted Zn-dependent insulinase-like peptidase